MGACASPPSEDDVWPGKKAGDAAVARLGDDTCNLLRQWWDVAIKPIASSRAIRVGLRARATYDSRPDQAVPSVRGDRVVRSLARADFKVDRVTGSFTRSCRQIV
jgi:hypothetical protein